MAAYSLAEARQQLDRLVEEALRGEVITSTRDGHGVVTLTQTAPAPIEAAYSEETRKRALARPSLGGDAVTLTCEMRDEER
jgi:antitoxin (DNA-binding transcriptional repressor) of toxin-antitoxin stability system